jgi:hypothetical protein
MWTALGFFAFSFYVADSEIELVLEVKQIGYETDREQT